MHTGKRTRGKLIFGAVMFLSTLLILWFAEASAAVKVEAYSFDYHHLMERNEDTRDFGKVGFLGNVSARIPVDVVQYYWVRVKVVPQQSDITVEEVTFYIQNESEVGVWAKEESLVQETKPYYENYPAGTVEDVVLLLVDPHGETTEEMFTRLMSAKLVCKVSFIDATGQQTQMDVPVETSELKHEAYNAPDGVQWVVDEVILMDTQRIEAFDDLLKDNFEEAVLNSDEYRFFVLSGTIMKNMDYPMLDITLNYQRDKAMCRIESMEIEGVDTSAAGLSFVPYYIRENGSTGVKVVCSMRILASEITQVDIIERFKACKITIDYATEVYGGYFGPDFGGFLLGPHFSVSLQFSPQCILREVDMASLP